MMYMLTRVCLSLALLWVRPGWSQIGSIPFEVSTTSANESQMLTPPPVSTEGYPTTVGSQTRSNYLAVGLISNTAYDDNVQADVSSNSGGDVIYTISPTITLNRTSPRQQLTLSYSPGFTFYQHTSTLNAMDQSATVNFQYRLSQHTTINVSDSLQKSSNVFDQLYPVSGGAISGSSQTAPVAVDAPYADQLSNTANMAVSYQSSRNGMIGVSGIATELNYLNPSEASGFYNSKSLGGMDFYNQRLSSAQYVGVTYQYVRSESNSVTAQANPATYYPDVQAHTFSAFYTIYLTPRMLSLSISGGPQYIDATQTLSPASSSWTPSLTASIGWQRSHTNFAASYSRTITGGLGLSGAYESNSASASVSWQIARTWTIGSAGSYSNNKNVTSSVLSSNLGGKTVSGTISVHHSISANLNMELGFSGLHQNYNNIAVLSSAPDSSREYISISYRLSRALGR
jgi:hypothetical protein